MAVPVVASGPMSDPAGSTPLAPPPGASGPLSARDSVFVGRTLFALGGLCLPFGLGVGLGFWVADRQVRWFPTTLAWLLGLWIVGLLLMILGGYRMGPAVGSPRGRKRIALCALLLVLAAGARLGLHVLARPTPLTALSRGELTRTAAEDAEQYRELGQALARVNKTLAARQELFPAQGGGPVPTADEEVLVLDAWETWFHAALALDRIRRFHEDYYRFDLSRRERPLHLQSYLLTFASELCLYARTLELSELLERNANVVKLLAEARPERGIPQDSVALVREELEGLSDLTRVKAGKHYLRWLSMVHDADEEASARGLGWLLRDVNAHLDVIEARRRRDLAQASVEADLSPWTQGLKRRVYPAQSKVAEWMGDTRFRRPPGRYLIGAEQQAALAPRLQPGDVLLGRKNWYLSNVGLPGFWPHALLWVGDDAQLRATFDQDPQVRAWVRAQCGEEVPYVDWLARSFPLAWADRARAGAEGEPLVIIEAVSEGVLQSALSHATGDYLAALRPNLPPVVKARAIARAFGWLGRPYDYEFDFATETTMVCSEVVWRAYRPEGELPGLELPLVTVLGRQTLPPHEIARLYAAEKQGPTQQFSFVAFLEGREHDLRAVERDEAAFLATPGRTKWDFRQE